MSDDQSSNSVVNQSGGVDIHADTVNIYGDVTGRDKIVADSSAQLHLDTRERYLEQIIRYHRDLDFVGIPELKDRQALQLEDVFIHLQTEIEAEMPLSEEERRIMREFADSRDAKGLVRWQAERNQLAHSHKITQKLGVNEALAKYNRIVILGDPGAGKTTLLKYVTLAFATHQSEHLGLTEDRLPIFIRLYDYVAKRTERQTDYALVDYLCTQAHENLALSLDACFFEDALERGECCVCLDGLDELGGAGLRREVIAAVNALVNKYPRNRYLITSRLVGYEEAPLDKREFVHHTVLPFSDDDISAFVTKWYDAREKGPTAAHERSKHLIDTIMREPRIKSLAANPLMLTIIALVHRIEAELPHERVKLYDKCVTAMIQTWEEVKGLRVEDRQRVYYKQRRRLLEQLAYWMHSQPGDPSTGSGGRAREIKEGDLELHIQRFLLENPKLSLDDETAHQEAHDFVQLVKGRTGLLIERGESVYSFAHLTFQEYLAATDIEHRLAHSIDAIWNEIRPRLHDAHWREVILLLLGSLNKFEQHPTELIRRIFETTDDYEPVLHRHLSLAARALADRVEVDTKLSNAIVDQLTTLTDAREWWIHYDGFAALGLLQDNSYAAARLLAIAQNLSVNVGTRRAAAQALGRLGQTDDAVGLLLAFAQNTHVDSGVRRDAAATLGQFGKTTEAASLLLTLVQDPQTHVLVRRTSAQKLGELGKVDDTVLNSILAIARDPQVDAGIRRASAQALIQLGQVDEAVEALFALAKDQLMDVWGRRSAVQLLGQLGPVDQSILVRILALTQDPQINLGIRREAALALGLIGQRNESVLKGLFALVREPDLDASFKSGVAQALSQLGQLDEALSILTDLTKDAQIRIEIRLEAAQALGQLGQVNDASRFLLAFVKDPQLKIEIRCEAAQALGQLGRVDQSMFKEMLALAENSRVYSKIRLRVALALNQLGQANETAKLLIALAQDPQIDIEARRDAVKALGQFRLVDPTILKALLNLTHNPQVNLLVRCISAQVLGQYSYMDESTRLLLEITLDHQIDTLIRREAYEGLKTLLDPES